MHNGGHASKYSTARNCQSERDKSVVALPLQHQPDHILKDYKI
jgi:hypothetical protein